MLARQGQRVVAAINNLARKLFIFQSLQDIKNCLFTFISKMNCVRIYTLHNKTNQNKNPDKKHLKTHSAVQASWMDNLIMAQIKFTDQKIRYSQLHSMVFTLSKNIYFFLKSALLK